MSIFKKIFDRIIKPKNCKKTGEDFENSFRPIDDRTISKDSGYILVPMRIKEEQEEFLKGLITKYKKNYSYTLKIENKPFTTLSEDYIDYWAPHPLAETNQGSLVETLTPHQEKQIKKPFRDASGRFAKKDNA